MHSFILSDAFVLEYDTVLAPLLFSLYSAQYVPRRIFGSKNGEVTGGG
jgi:hypothetical protein